MIEAFDFKPVYRAENWGGIAWRVTGYVKIRDEDYEWSGIEQIVEDRVVAHMVGDDVGYEFEISELTPISDDEYCWECGQIGCTGDGRS